MQAESQISLHEIGPPFNSSGGAIIHLGCGVKARCDPASDGFFSTALCTDHSIRQLFADNLMLGKWHFRIADLALRPKIEI